VAHAGQRLDGLGEVVGEDSPVLSAAPVAAHPGQGGAAHGVVDGLLSGRRRKNRKLSPGRFTRRVFGSPTHTHAEKQVESYSGAKMKQKTSFSHAVGEKTSFSHAVGEQR